MFLQHPQSQPVVYTATAERALVTSVYDIDRSLNIYMYFKLFHYARRERMIWYFYVFIDLSTL